MEIMKKKSDKTSKTEKVLNFFVFIINISLILYADAVLQLSHHGFFRFVTSTLELLTAYVVTIAMIAVTKNLFARFVFAVAMFLVLVFVLTEH
jgi:branched-subunit amino acid transport protein